MDVNKVHMVTYNENHIAIVKDGISSIKSVLKGNNFQEKESLLFCLDKYLDPWYGYNLPYANEIFELLEYVVIEPNNKDIKEEALHLLQVYSWPPFKILENNLDKIEQELISDVKYIINMDKEL